MPRSPRNLETSDPEAAPPDLGSAQLPSGLFTLYYRFGSHGVKSGFIVATDLAQAEAIGRAFCDQHISSRYIRVENAILADASILDRQPVGVSV